MTLVALRRARSDMDIISPAVSDGRAERGGGVGDDPVGYVADLDAKLRAGARAAPPATATGR